VTGAPTLQGVQVEYRLRREVETAGDLEFPLDLIASVDEAIDDLCRVGSERGLDPAAVLLLTPYFGTIWPAARALARWLAARTTWPPGQVVVELGCGLALPSLVAARRGARAVATDRHPDVPALLARNAALCGVTVEHDATDWTDLDQVEALRRRLGAVDLVLASDVLYEAELAETLPVALARLCGPTTRVALADPGRPHLQRAVEALERRGFAVRLDVLAVPGRLDAVVGGGTQEVFVLDATCPPGPVRTVTPAA
jgi:predicted nicotinamide N-methyase